ncbi:PREDICTED: zinc finger BED domain-containing protein RICESLEEPER 3-like [Nicotiana attenuata]|uniref:zinc finger BED domain-containing protein RICESLEEPER 3-like n=1 Tax=Nicotiana attenuata TaxID=49451 RepID=UPI000904C6D4|nr:PREDICTED: zinc finger BED domain-containing protein RICESLEEPER 3-like [Nicotiana attenuata]
MRLTSNFIDRDWVLHKRTLNFFPFSSHKGDGTAKVIGNCLLEWKSDKVFIVTVDNASSNDVTVKEFSKQLDMWKTNSMSGKWFEGIDISVKHVRQAVRWNSTYLMLETAQNFEEAFDKLHLFYDGFSTHPCMHVYKDGNVAGPFICDDLVNVRNAINFLERFNELTEKVSDPHNRLEYVGFALEQMFGKEPGKKLTAEVDAYLNSLFGEYQNKYSKGCYLQSSPSKSTSSDDISDLSSRNVRNLVASKYTFSTGGRIFDLFRSSLTPRLVQSLVCVQDWFRCEGTPINVGEDLGFLEQIELGSTMPHGPKARSPIWEHFEVVKENE